MVIETERLILREYTPDDFAAAIGLRKIKEYPDKDSSIHYVYAITTKEWQDMK